MSDQMVDPHHNKGICLRCEYKITNTTQIIDVDMIFLYENPNQKNHGEE